MNYFQQFSCLVTLVNY